MSDQTPDYGTRPEPKYGQYGPTPPPRITVELETKDGLKVTTDGNDVEETTRSAITELEHLRATTPRRDPFGIVLALAMLAVATFLAWGAMHGGWWSLLWTLQGPFAIIGAYGLIQDARKAPRDENGNRIRP